MTATRGRAGLIEEIAARRREDIVADLGTRRYRDLVREADRAASPRDPLALLARPGLHLIAEAKRRSPSAGALAGEREDLAARARAYQAGGASIVSVVVEPHWFDGSVADLATVRRSVTLPILAKDFVVDPRQLPALRAAGADLVLLLAALHSPAALRRLLRLARETGLEPLVEAHDERELEGALASGARLIGINNRDLRTLSVDPGLAARLRRLVPDDRLVVAESGAREPAALVAWRALGFDAALVGEALMRAGTDAPAVTSRTAAFVAAGRPPSRAEDPGAADRVPFVKICGLTERAAVLAAVRAQVDAIGINFVPGSSRCVDLDRAAELAASVREIRGDSGRPLIVGVFADRDAGEVEALADALDLDAIQLSGDEPPASIAAAGRPVWKVLHVPAAEVGDPSAAAGVADAAAPPGAAGVAAAASAVVARGRGYLAHPRVTRLLLDTAHPAARGGTGRRADADLVSAVAREIPVTLAGGLDATNVSGALRSLPVVGVDVASGVERAGSAPRPLPGSAGADAVAAGGDDAPPGRAHPPTAAKDPLLIALFAKRAKAARTDDPLAPVRPTPVHAGILDADERGRWGVDRAFGGRYVPETLVAALDELERAWRTLRRDPAFWAEFRRLAATYIGRPSPVYRADRLAAELEQRADREPGRLRLYLKREDLNHTGAHKITNALGQALLTRRLGKSRVIAETGAGQHGVATATACALLGLPCVVYMGAEDIRRQAPNVLRMRVLGAEVRSVTSGSATLKDAINEAMRDWVTNVAKTHFVLGSAVGPHPYPALARDLQRVIGDEAAAQLDDVEGRLPDAVVACVGGGSNAIGLFSRFIGEPSVQLVAVEASGLGLETGKHAAALAGGTPGVLHGSRSYLLQDADGQVVEAHSISAGLDYPGIGPQHAALHEAGRMEVLEATDAEALDALRLLTATEGIIPALEPSHAIAGLGKLLRQDTNGAHAPLVPDALVLLGLSGRGDKDLDTLDGVSAAGADATAPGDVSGSAGVPSSMELQS